MKMLTEARLKSLLSEAYSCGCRDGIAAAAGITVAEGRSTRFIDDLVAKADRPDKTCTEVIGTWK